MKSSIVRNGIAWICILALTAVYARISWIEYANLRNGIDLGTYTQILSNLSSFQHFPPYNSILGTYAWGDHAHFIMVLLSPLFAIYPHDITPILLQLVAITTSAWTLFDIAHRRFKNLFFSYAILFSYLLFFGIQYALSFDVHANVFTAAALSWLFWAHYNKKYIPYWTMLGLALITREDAALFCVALGIYCMIFEQKQEKIRGAITVVVSAIYFLIVCYGIMPSLQSHNTVLAYFDVDTSSKTPFDIINTLSRHPVKILQNMVDSSVKIRTIKNTFGSFGLLPLASPFTYLAVAPNFIARFLSGEQQRWDMKLHYSASLASILSYGAILGTAVVSHLLYLIIGRIQKLKKRTLELYATSLCAIALIYGTYSVSLHDIDLPIHQLIAHKNAEIDPYAQAMRSRLDTLAQSIPESDSIATISSFVPVLAARPNIHNISNITSDSADWIILSNRFTAWPLSRSDVNTAIHLVRQNSNYTETTSSDG